MIIFSHSSLEVSDRLDADSAVCSKMAAVPFISVHVSQQLDNQPVQKKSIVLIGLYLLYNYPAGNP